MYDTVEVPFVLIGNRQCLTDAQLAESGWLRDFFNQFRACFEYDPLRQIWLFNPA